MIKKEDFINILNNKICPICKLNCKIRDIENHFDCINCGIFYAGNNNLSKYFGYRYCNRSVFVFSLEDNNDIKKYFVDNNRNIDDKTYIYFNTNKIPQSIEDLDKLYIQVEKIKVFK